MKKEITASEQTNLPSENVSGQTTPANREKYSAQIELPDTGNEASLEFMAYLDKSPMATAFHRMIFDGEGKPVDYLFLDANERFFELTGVDPRGKLVTEAFPGIENDPGNWINTYGEVVLSGNSIRFKQHLEFDNRWYDCFAFAYKPNHFLVTFLDITESINAKQKLKDVANYFQTIIENAPDGIALIDASGEFNYISASGRRMFGYAVDEPIHTNPAEITHPDDLEFVLSHLMRVMADSTYIPTLEYRFASKDGHWIWIETTFRNLLHDPNVASIIMNFRDITQQKLDDIVIREKDVQYRNLANSSPALIWTSDTSKLCNYFNSTWLHFTGRTLEQEMGNGWTEGVHPDDYDNCLTTYINAFDKQEPFEMEYRLKHVGGDYRWILDMGTPNYNAEGLFIGYIGNCFEITERKEIENQLRLSEIKFRNTFECSVVAKSLTSIEGNVNVNKAFCNLLGYSKKELSEMNWRKFTHPDDVANNELINTSILDGEIDSANWLKRYIHKDGHTIWVNITTILLRDKDGNPDHFVTEVYDISAQKKAEEALKESERRYDTLLQHLETGIVVHAPDTSIKMSNQRASVLLGLSNEQMAGKVAVDLAWNFVNTDNSIVPLENYPVNKIIAKKQALRNQVLGVQQPDNTNIVWLTVNGFPVLNDAGETVEIVISFNDITEQKIAEQKLVESETFFRQSQEAAKIGSYNLNMASGRWTSSEVLDSIFGIDKAFVRDVEAWSALVYQSDKSMMNDYFANYVLGQKNRFDKEYRISQKADGKVVWVHGLGELIIENGEVISMVGTIQDITERKLAEQKLAESELFFRQSQEAAKIGSYNLNMATGLWTSSKVLDKIFGIDEKYIRSIENWISLIDERDKNIMAEYSKNFVSARERRFNKEYRIIRKTDGKILWVHGIGELIIENDTVVSMVGTLQDITDRKTAEFELQGNMETLQRFNNLTVGRELNMIELKKEVNELLTKSGQPPKYKIIE